MGDKYQIYLLEDRESRPTAVVLPRGEGMDETIDKGTEVRGRVCSSGCSAADHIPAAGSYLVCV